MPSIYPAIPEPSADPQSLLRSVQQIKESVELLTGQRGDQDEYDMGLRTRRLESTFNTESTQLRAVIATNERVFTSADEALAERSTALEAEIIDARSGEISVGARILEVDTARVTGDSALSTRTTVIESEINNARGGQTDLLARITQVDTARATGDGALATRATTLEAQMNNTTASALQARIQTEETTRATADSALSTRTTTLEAQMNNTTASALQARIQTEETARVDADTALSTRATTLEASSTTYAGQLGNTIASGLQSRIATEETARATADSALSTRATTLEAQMNNTTASPLQARIATEETARVNGDSANATSITNLTTTVNGNTANISSLTSSVNGISVKYALTGNINGTTGGFTLTGVQQTGGGAVFNLEINSNVVINGSLLVNGTVNTTQIAAGAATVGDDYFRSATINHHPITTLLYGINAWDTLCRPPSCSGVGDAKTFTFTLASANEFVDILCQTSIPDAVAGSSWLATNARYIIWRNPVLQHYVNSGNAFYGVPAISTVLVTSGTQVRVIDQAMPSNGNNDRIFFQHRDKPGAGTWTYVITVEPLVSSPSNRIIVGDILVTTTQVKR